MSAKIIVQGAKERNLKNISFEIPKGKLVALTGPSGSGKSTIAVEILQKECLRQYLESLGLTTDHLTKANVERIEGLSPAIGISQRRTDFNPRSTVGTKTGILAILRNLFAAAGEQLCGGCERRVKPPLQDKDNLLVIEVETASKKKTKRFFSCPHCNHRLELLTMAHFSCNGADGACKACKGSGETVRVELAKLLNEEKGVRDGGVAVGDEKTAAYYEKVLQAASDHYRLGLNTNLPLREYTEEQRNFLLYGIAFPEFVKAHQHLKEPKKVGDGKFEGIIPPLLRTNSEYVLREPCPECQKARLGSVGRETTVGGKTILDAASLPLSELLVWIYSLKTKVPEQVLEVLSTALNERISNLIEVGLGYLSLDRTLPSLSSGESGRLRLANVLGSGLTGVLYVLDEPTTGLHPYDTEKLVGTLRKIQEAGNTVVLIEHDLEAIKQVDYILDLGPGGGSRGGELVAFGTPDEVMACKASPTGRCLARKGAVPAHTCLPAKHTLTVRGANEQNLQGMDVAIPVNQLVVLTGVSGSGKSTFLFDILDKTARNYLHRASHRPGKHTSVDGLEHFQRVAAVDPATIQNAQASRSNIATYTKLFDWIRDLFASLPKAKARGLGREAFSFNISEERCKNCNGAGTVAIDMSFLPEVEMECPVCHGMRFTEEVLTVEFQGRSIASILEMTVDEAAVFFKHHPLLDALAEIGLGYLKLGQSTSTLSGGEAQRIKLAMELSKPEKESTLYLLDEPTTGLHPEEVDKLLATLQKLVSRGHTVVAIEHHLDAMAAADWIIDFGPGGGNKGGRIVATGTPLEVAANADSLTGQCLKRYLQG